MMMSTDRLLEKTQELARLLLPFTQCKFFPYLTDTSECHSNFEQRDSNGLFTPSKSESNAALSSF